MKKISLKTISSLEKILPLSKLSAKSFSTGSCLLNEEFSYQIAFKIDEFITEEQPIKIEIISDITEFIQIYNVKYIPVYLPHFKNMCDECYISHKPGLFPDILEPYTDCVMASGDFYKTLWINIKPKNTVKPGVHKIKVLFKDGDDICAESVFSLEIIGVELPKTNIPITNWFHCDSIADYYGVKQLSKKHWDLIENFLSLYTEHGHNMILTPIFTPALDTKVGGERPTVQLVDVMYDNGKYSFGFEKLLKWITICKKHGIKYLEISHLFSQWGAEHTPKIIVKQNGKNIKKFGWQTDALSQEYKDFLSQLLPALKEVLLKNWDADKIYFHLSDEPNSDHINHYGEIYNFVKPFLKEFNLMDAISEYELYSKGFIDTPVVATHKVKNFLDQKINKIWAYYCCSQGSENYSNRFIAMPSFRNRITGTQIYALGIKGFLHWGYNFYYCRLSTHKINPYLTADTDGGFPAGDAFSVYPTQNGAIPSLRFKVFHHGLQDYMALSLLETKIGKKAVLEILEKENKIDFNHYPMTNDYILQYRKKINELIKEKF